MTDAMDLELGPDTGFCQFATWGSPCQSSDAGAPWKAQPGAGILPNDIDFCDEELPSPIFSTPGEALSPGMDLEWEDACAVTEPNGRVGIDGADGFEWWGSMENLVDVRSASLPAAPPQASPSTITVRCAGKTQAVELGTGPSTPEAVACAIRQAFGMTDAALVLLRECHSGCLVPLTACWAMVGSGEFDLVQNAANSTALVVPENMRASHALPSVPLIAPPSDAACLEFVQEPPKGTCEWLTISLTKSGAPKPIEHTFAIEISVKHPTNTHGSDDHEAKELAWLENAKVRLFNPCMDDVSSLLHTGCKKIQIGADGRRSVRWSEVGITGVSSSNSIGVLNVERSKNAIRGGRCAQGWYHLCISSPGAADLFLRANSSGAEMELARIIVKHKRCYATGRWVEKRLGPYADHTLCRPSHIGADGSRLCNGASCCQGTQSTQSGAANLNMNRDGTIIGFVPNRNESSGR